MKVFCIGLSRTGTTSISEALNIIDIPSLHYSPYMFAFANEISEELRFVPKQKLSFFSKLKLNKELKALKLWNDNENWSNYESFADLPIPNFYKFLDHKFPGSKFIYTFRSEDKWLTSMKWMLSQGRILWKWGILDDEILFQTYNTLRYDSDLLVEVFRKHHSDVLSYFKDRPKDILILNIDEKKVTFSDLCTFLNKALPVVPFPEKNSSINTTKLDYMIYWVNRRIPYLNIIFRKFLYLIPALSPKNIKVKKL